MRIHLPGYGAAMGCQLLQAVFFFKQQALVFLSLSYILNEGGKLHILLVNNFGEGDLPPEYRAVFAGDLKLPVVIRGHLASIRQVS